jgi:hypothetical protein
MVLQKNIKTNMITKTIIMLMKKNSFITVLLWGRLREQIVQLI